MTKNRNGKIDLLKFIFALIIVLKHGAEYIPVSLGNNLSTAALGVEFFFIVSGYLMAASASRSADSPPSRVGLATQTFIRKKFLALMPEFAVATVMNFVIYMVFLTPKSLSKFLNVIYKFIMTLVPIGMTGIAQKSDFTVATWYISAMLLAMFVLYPLCVKHFDTFTRIIAPVVGLFLLGFFAFNYGSPRGPKTFVDIGGLTFFYKGFLRGVCEISLGAAVFPLCESFKKVRLGTKGRLLVSAAELASFVLPVLWMAVGRGTRFDIQATLCLVVLAFFAFSHQGLFAGRFDCAPCYRLGALSMVVYFAHPQIADVMENINNILVSRGLIPDSGVSHAVILWAIYIGLSASATAFVVIISNLLKKRKAR